MGRLHRRPDRARPPARASAPRPWRRHPHPRLRPETAIAEKGVTLLERGIASTRWRDYVDIVQLARSQPLDPALLRASAQAVAAHRGVTLEPVTPHLQGYGAVAQPKWAAWRRREGFDTISEEHLDDQIGLVADVLDPILAHAD